MNRLGEQLALQTRSVHLHLNLACNAVEHTRHAGHHRGLKNLEIFHQALNLARKVADRAAHVQDIGLPAPLVNMRKRQVRNRH